MVWKWLFALCFIIVWRYSDKLWLFFPRKHKKLNWFEQGIEWIIVIGEGGQPTFQPTLYIYFNGRALTTICAWSLQSWRRVFCDKHDKRRINIWVTTSVQAGDSWKHSTGRLQSGSCHCSLSLGRWRWKVSMLCVLTFMF